MKALYGCVLVLAALFCAVPVYAQAGVCDPTDVPKVVDGKCHFSAKCGYAVCRVEEGAPFPAELADFSKMMVVVEGDKPTPPAPAPAASVPWYKAFSFGPVFTGWETAGDFSFGGGLQVEWYATKHLFLQARGIVGTAGGKTRTNFGLETSLGPGLQLDFGLRFGVRGAMLYYPETDKAPKERASERFIGAEAFIGYHNRALTRGLLVEASAGYGARYREVIGSVWHGRASIASLSVGWLF